MPSATQGSTGHMDVYESYSSVECFEKRLPICADIRACRLEGFGEEPMLAAYLVQCGAQC